VLQGVLLDQLPPGSVTLQAGFEGFEQDGQVGVARVLDLGDQHG
jgi:hypothetical protein